MTNKSKKENKLDKTHVESHLNKLYNNDEYTLVFNEKLLNKIVFQNIYDTASLENFIKDVKSKKISLNSIGRNAYNPNDPESKLYINVSTVPNKTLENVFNYINANYTEKKIYIQEFNNVSFFEKKKDTSLDNNINNFRFMCQHTDYIKLIDKLFVNKVKILCGNDLINNNIFKSENLKFKNLEFENCLEVATKNTETLDNGISIDIQKAFDSVDWYLLKILLLKSLSKKVNHDIAISLVEEYFLILTNRNFYYKDDKINVKKGVSQGLPSSNFIFTLFFQEIVNEWIEENNFIIDVDFTLNIFVDDVYIKIINHNNPSHIVESFINILAKYKLYVNKQKSKTDPKLNISYLGELTINDLYLGIPFTRNLQEYVKIIINEYIKRHRKKNIKSWNVMYYKLTNDESKIKNHLFGFLLYKLKPIIESENKIKYKKFTRENILSFIKDKLITEDLTLKEPVIKKLEEYKKDILDEYIKKYKKYNIFSWDEIHYNLINGNNNIKNHLFAFLQHRLRRIMESENKTKYIILKRQFIVSFVKDKFL